VTRSVLEERVYQSQFRSGQLEVFVGLGLALIGLAWVSGHIVLGAVVPAVLSVLWPGFRRRFVTPRAGHMKMRASRMKRERRALSIVVLLGFLALAVVFATILVADLGSETVVASDLVRALPACIVAAGALLVALVLGIRRTWLYAIPLVVSGALCVVFELDPGWSLVGSGAVILLAGIALLLDFVRETPAHGPE